MPEPEHIIDIKYVTEKLHVMQSQKAWGELTIKFERGIMQIINMNLHFVPPSNKKFEGTGEKK